MRTFRSFITAVGLGLAAMLMPGQTPAASARIGIDAGNQAWINGIKAGDMQRIAAHIPKMRSIAVEQDTVSRAVLKSSGI